MCLTPVRLRTSTIYRSSNGYSKYYIEVPCGQCAECQQQRKNDWYLRNYFESESIWNSGGYVLFDTLTYDDRHIPTVSKLILGTDIDRFPSWTSELESLDNFTKLNKIDKDFRSVISIFKKCNYTCFDYHDIQNFLKLLRIRLERSGYDVENNLRYFIASEYGHDENYVDSAGRHRRGTNRPHYHILFYVNGSCNLSPQVLSMFISLAWTNGRTDGVFYRGNSYVLGHNVFGPKYISDPVRLRGVQYYVSKYVCKDYEFHDSIDKRISYVLTQLYGISYDSPSYKDMKRTLHRFMDQFHRQSLAFGFDGLIRNPNVMYDVLYKGKIQLPDKERVVKTFSIPLFYVRKIFQECVKDSEGRPHWVWNDLGKEWRKNRISESVCVLADKMQNWYDNIDDYADSFCDYRTKIDKILNGRTFKDYAEYVIYYKGRFCKDPTLPDSIDIIVDNSLENPLNSNDLYIKVGDDCFEYNGQFYSHSDLEKFVMSDSCLGSKYKGFDDLYNLYHITMMSYSLNKQETYEKKLALQKELKAMGYKTKKKI